MSIHLEKLRPTNDYATLRRQFIALKHLAVCQQDELKLYKEIRTTACWEEWKDEPQYQSLSSSNTGGSDATSILY